MVFYKCVWLHCVHMNGTYISESHHTQKDFPSSRTQPPPFPLPHRQRTLCSSAALPLHPEENPLPARFVLTCCTLPVPGGYVFVAHPHSHTWHIIMCKLGGVFVYCVGGGRMWMWRWQHNCCAHHRQLRSVASKPGRCCLAVPSAILRLHTLYKRRHDQAWGYGGMLVTLIYMHDDYVWWRYNLNFVSIWDIWRMLLVVC